MDLESMMENAAEEQLADANLGDVSKIAQAQVAAQDEIKLLEKELKAAKENLQVIQTQTLPEAMLEAGLASLTLESGASVSLRDEYGCSMLAETRQEAISYLEENFDAQDIIKCTVTVQFGAKELGAAIDLAKELEAQGYNVAAGRSIHAATLKKWFKETEEAHDLLPNSLFNTFIGHKTYIK